MRVVARVIAFIFAASTCKIFGAWVFTLGGGVHGAIITSAIAFVVLLALGYMLAERLTPPRKAADRQQSTG